MYSVKSPCLGVIFILNAFFIGPSKAQNYGSKAFAKAGASVTQKDEWTGLNNPGALNFSEKKSLSAGATIPYGVPELASVFFTGVFSSPIGKLGISAMHQSFTGVQQNQFLVGGAYGKSDFSFGGRLSLLSLNMGEYGSLLVPSIDIGGLVNPVPKLDFAIQASNITFSRISLGGFEEILPMHIRVGTAYQTSESLQLCLEAIKRIDVPLNILLAIDWKVSRHFSVMGGTSLNENTHSAGFLFHSKSWVLGPALRYSHMLGASTSFSLSYILNEAS